MDGFPFIPETSDWESDTDRFNLWTQITSAKWIKSYKEWLDKSASHNKTPATLGLGLSDVAGPSRQQDSAPSRGPSLEEIQRRKSASALATEFDSIRAGGSAKDFFANRKKSGSKLFGKKRSDGQVKGQEEEATNVYDASHKRQASKSPMLDGAVWRKLTGKRRTDE
ncbi:hypothetical protein CBOM_05651 [Ceraceosorus bombacis]|uniref:Uncharacterized protein n=1 Tax=Ceraceosorus bombacis TaxID=401625 RepID=A0A0P1BR00_9BASI|nr:hypothetical protein CBOM_05651 [Ceraceosorus bombacis]